ncbi:MAG: PilZ domain-containing protein [Rhodoferax sp.]|nr:PilZ domain-containing protein [Rhodoferax sp.]
MPIELNGVQGLTRNISATGIYFESQVDQKPGSVVQFIVEVDVQGEKLKMVCKGEVVRVDHKDGVVGIAVKLANSFFTDPD